LSRPSTAPEPKQTSPHSPESASPGYPSSTPAGTTQSNCTKPPHFVFTEEFQQLAPYVDNNGSGDDPGSSDTNGDDSGSGGGGEADHAPVEHAEQQVTAYVLPAA
jgi:hypothetical protein